MFIAENGSVQYNWITRADNEITLLGVKRVSAINTKYQQIPNTKYQILNTYVANIKNNKHKYQILDTYIANIENKNTNTKY